MGVRWSHAYGGSRGDGIDGFAFPCIGGAWDFDDQSKTDHVAFDHFLQGLLVDFVELGRYLERTLSPFVHIGSLSGLVFHACADSRNMALMITRRSSHDLLDL